MNNKFENKNLSNNAQTATELAIFGAILIFIISVIVRQSFSYGMNQNQQLRAMRLAMKTSYEYSEGVKGPNPGYGSASRNSASILFIEDRLSPTSDKYGSLDRVPQFVSGRATRTRNLFQPFESGSTWNLPAMDVYVNGKHFVFTTANIVSYSVLGDFYTVIPNHPKIAQWCDHDGAPSAKSCDGGNLTADQRFDLDRSDLDRGSFSGLNPGTDVPLAERETFSWQWYRVTPSEVNPENGANTSVDVDQDLKEERVLSINGSTVEVIDFQEGDVDFSLGSSDTEDPPGFTNDLHLFAYTQDGTYLQIQEGKLYGADKQYVRHIQKKDKVDMIQRVFKLSNNTGRYCSSGVVNNDPSIWAGVSNPVEACNDCFSSANISRTCMDEVNLLIFIRSRIYDRGGRKWITDVSDDEYIKFSR